MTTPTPQEQAEQFRTEIRNALKTIQARIEQTTERIMQIENVQADERNTLDELTKAIETMLHGIKQAAAATPPAATPGTFSEMMIEKIVLSYNDEGKPTYKAKGTPFSKFGVKIWDEVIPALGIDPATLKPGTNEIEPIRARVLMGETTNAETGAVGIGPRKVTGKI